MIHTIWHHRGFIAASIRREFHLRYKTSALGTLWAVINPLALVFIYTVVFSQVMSARLNGVDSIIGYGIYLCAGILCWNSFSETALRCQNIFIENANVIKKMAFPKICLPIIAAGNALIGFFIMLCLIVVFVLFAGMEINASLLFLLPLVALHMLMAIGVGIFLGVLNVFFRDVGQFSGIAFQFWFWLTPIVYPMSIIPPQFAAFLYANPLTNIVVSYQQVLVHGEWPAAATLLYPCVFTFFALALSKYLYSKCAVDIVDEL